MESPGKIELPRAFEHADVDHLVVLIADMLNRLIGHNDKIPLSPYDSELPAVLSAESHCREALTRFHSRTPPTIGVLDYLRRIVKYANVERTCLLITLHYIDQICARLPHFTISSLTCHRFIIAAVVVSSKALCDAFCTNAHYAKVGGIRVGELNLLEKELLSSLDWHLTVRPLSDVAFFGPVLIRGKIRQSTREVLDAYYVNLIRTHGSGEYVLAPEPTSPALSNADSDMDSYLSASPSPSGVPTMMEDERPAQMPTIHVAPNGADSSTIARSSTEPRAIEPSTVLIDRATLPPKPSAGPTLEQNMAFEALRKASSIIDPATNIKEGSEHTSPTLTNNAISMDLSNSTKSSPVWKREKRTVEKANGGSELLQDEVVDIDSVRPRTRPRIEDDGHGIG
ncbi:cyclin-domain-containing protein [Fomitiporia mediterranea MF3/22]|uniref:cyclin-domain-containing protein n=1 Tax=Fomitiporia mediterranea (strain MF3/22) TaxID=694068 RepID=UPI00044078B5|nr:cyclin-domain-containing protein [Fomitiporia mediterranea MF3/22]EJD02733.1 cyclin-domain-containing protein [Fomitiporia mediterranea MF3/22]